MVKSIWFVFTVYILEINQNKPHLHTFPEDNLSWLTKQTTQAVSPLHEVVLGNQRTSVVYQQLLLGRQTKSSWL